MEKSRMLRLSIDISMEETFKLLFAFAIVLYFFCSISAVNSYCQESFVGKDPYIMIDSEDNANILWSRDTNRDGEEDAMYFAKIDKRGKCTIKEKIILHSTIFIEPICFIDSNDFIHIIWFHPERNYYKENKEFRPGSHPYFGDIYYKKIDNSGRTLIESSRVASDILESYCRKDIPYPCYLSYKIDAIRKIAGDVPKEMEGTFRDLISKLKHVYNITDSNGNVHKFCPKSYSCSDTSGKSLSCYGAPAVLCYTKQNRNGEILVKDRLIARHEKQPVSQHGPDIISMRSKMDSQNNIHIVWYVNDGMNHFTSYYKKLNNNGEEIEAGE